MMTYDEALKIANKGKRGINRYFRDTDESHLWPIRNRFKATERAIRRLREHGLVDVEYVLALDAEISRIVNDSV